MNLTQARTKRGWSFHTATQHMRGVYEQQLRNLEGQGATRTTDPLNVSLKHVLEILRAYWPDVALDDFVGEATGLRLMPTDGEAQRSLRRHAATVFVDKSRAPRHAKPRTRTATTTKRRRRGAK